MATNQVLITAGTSFVWANSTYSPGDANDVLGTYSATYDIDVVGLTAGQARNSLKADLGASHAPSFSVDMSVEPALDPTAGDSVDLYWSESISATAAVGNQGSVTGADADYAGYDTVTLAVALRQMLFIGSFPLGVANDADGVQIGHVGIFSPVLQYGSLVYHWNVTTVAIHTDSIECAVRFMPFFPDIQAAA